MPSRRATRLRLYADEMGRPLVADGSDFIVVVAEVTDDEGNVRRQALEHVTFTVEGEGTIIGDAGIAANPRLVEWGSAPVLVRSTHKAGEIRIIARPAFGGVHAPAPDTLTIHSLPTDIKQCYSIEAAGGWQGSTQPKPDGAKPQITDQQRREALDEVGRQQQEYGIQ